MVDALKAKELGNRVAALKLRMEAATSEYTAAVIMSDAKEQERIRNNLHTFLDASLDAITEMGVIIGAAGDRK